MRICDFLIVGAGIVGAALAAEIARRRPGSRVLVVEKEARPAFHQTGRNSGVVHSGVYYTPGSLKARFCREGAELTRAFCTARNIGYDERGKLIVATGEEELPRLEALCRRAAENGVAAVAVDGAAMRRLEPAVAGRAALRIPAPGDQACLLEHLEMLGYGRLAHFEGFGQVHDRNITLGRQPRQNGPAGGVGQGMKSGV